MCDANTESHGIIPLRIKSPVFINESNQSIPASSSNSITTPIPFSSTNCQLGSSPISSLNPAALAEYHRLQIYDYVAQANARYRFGHPAIAGPYSLAAAAAAAYSHPAFSDTSSIAMSPFARFDPRFRFMHEEPKPQHSYIGLIAMAILSSPEQKMVLSDIYQYILDNYPYFRNRGPGWRNSIRHNLSLNDCFVKAGRSANGKGHYWAIHPANLEDFKKGDFRRRKAQRKVRKHMGLSVPDEDDSPSPTPPPVTQSNSRFDSTGLLGQSDLHIAPQQICAGNVSFMNDIRIALSPRKHDNIDLHDLRNIGNRFEHSKNLLSSIVRTNKRQFDVESLLAPDCDSTVDDCGNFNNDNNQHKDKQSEISITEQIETNDKRESPSINNHFVITKADSIESNSSSPSISSTAEKNKFQPMIPFIPDSVMNFPNPTLQNAQLKSLQNLQHQMNAGLINPSLLSSGSSNFGPNMPWAMSALSNAQVAATLLGYASVANQNFDIQGNKH